METSVAQFYYEALSKDGKKTSGIVDASTAAAARTQLSRQGLYPTSVKSSLEMSNEKGFSLRQIFEKKISLKDKILFTKQLSVLLKSGVPLLQALELLIEQFEGRMRTIIINLKDGIKEGRSLAYGMSLYPSVFDNIFVQLVRAGEASGKLEVILDRLTDFIEKRAQIAQRVKSALRGPLIQLGVVFLVVIFLMTWVVPSMAETFAEQGAALPGATQFLMTVSNIIRSYYLILLLLAVLIFVSFKYWASTKNGALLIDKIKLRLPLVKYFSRMGTVVQFSRTLGMLVESGVNLSESLDIVVHIVQNRVLTKSLMEARDKIIKEGKIAPYLKETGLFPPIAIYLINTGEQSGQLGFMLLTVAQNYENDLTENSENLTAFLQPIMLIVMAVIVGFIVIAIMSPIMNQANLIG